MHAVILKENGIRLRNPQEDGSRPFELYICCHLRRVEVGEEALEGGEERESVAKEEAHFTG
jgi:hypothetical protein